MFLDLVRSFEQTQYSGGTCNDWCLERDQQAEILGQENPCERWYRPLYHFYCLKCHRIDSIHLKKSSLPLPRGCHPSCNLRHKRAYSSNISKTLRFSNTYFQNVLCEWNFDQYWDKKFGFLWLLWTEGAGHDKNIDKRNIQCPSYTGIKWLEKLHVKLIHVTEHTFRHNFDCITFATTRGK